MTGNVSSYYDKSLTTADEMLATCTEEVNYNIMCKKDTK
jgi:hypothetical protein